MITDFLSLLFPQNCINCNRSLISEEKFICTSCKIEIPYTNDYLNHENELFKKFIFAPEIKSARAFMYFHQDGIAQKLLHNLKYKRKKEIGVMLGNWFAQELHDTKVDCIIPVPIHKQKQRVRGYNQSDFIAAGISEVLGLEIQSNAISRIVLGPSQTMKSKVKRWSDLENVYSEVITNLEGTKVLIVDDVVTTGATVGMLSDRLIEAGVKEIHIATLARGK